MSWTKKEDKLPKTDDSGCIEVLVLMDSMYYTLADFINDCKQERFYYSNNKIFEDISLRVTHWQYLEGLPK
jgi:hypothetical protein